MVCRQSSDACMIHWLSGCFLGTYRDKNAVRVLGLAGLVCAHEVGQAPDVVDAHHVDVVVEAERLDEGEVDLESDIALVLLIGGEDAECHAVWVTVEANRGERERERAGQNMFAHALRLKKKKKSEKKRPVVITQELQYLHIHDFGGFVNSNCQVVLLLSSDQQLLQGCACTLHPSHRRRKKHTSDHREH